MNDVTFGHGNLLAQFFRLAVLVLGGSVVRGEVSYNRDVLPILSAKCFACHGVDKARRKADLRLDVRKEALADRDGVRAIVPGKPDHSELIRRIFTADADEAMPPAEEGRPLVEKERRILKQWIAEGAVYERHWAFQMPRKNLVPDSGEWGRNEIDGFIFARLVEAKLAPQNPASWEQLIRRVSLDLTGLPPTIDEVDSFLADESERAYERVVDRLLHSPRYGERWGRHWLDLARYADSNGLDENLAYANAFRYRDYVVAAFNKDKPYDRFLQEQLA
ncbi:MAG: DUF1549 domain-containing protein, partial [Planctomycetes bacterium]|nr:DUF1549 domain-containing protein [Planctomycetota bacterium]